MTPSAAILSRLQYGPQHPAGLHHAVCTLTHVQPGKEQAIWGIVWQEIHQLRAAGLIRQDEAGVWMLTSAAKV
jgi:hypothetical protein